MCQSPADLFWCGEFLWLGGRYTLFTLYMRFVGMSMLFKTVQTRMYVQRKSCCFPYFKIANFVFKDDIVASHFGMELNSYRVLCTTFPYSD